jgi:steroid 5-alpha reductase family enzyme
MSLPLRDASIVDVFWGLGFVAIACLSLLASPMATPRTWLIAGLTTTWGLRLAGYLAWRKFGQPEDHRYEALRRQFGGRFWLVSLLLVFGLQGVLMWIVSLPLQLAPFGTSGLNGMDALGTAVWALGLAFESVGDFQLARFKADPANRGQACDRGLWRYTRHPNYFGDFLVWWGLYLIALAGGAPWWTLASPLVMSYLLTRVSGVQLLEKSLKDRTAGYQEYVLRTSAFFPWPPRRR